MEEASKSQKKKILLIDDEEDFCFFVKLNLEKTGKFEVLTTTSGSKGIILASKEQPDLILLDINYAGDQRRAGCGASAGKSENEGHSRIVHYGHCFEAEGSGS